MPYEIETKDGIVIRGIPDNIRPDDPSIRAKVANARQAAGRPQVSAADRAMADPTGSFTQNALAGAGKGFTDAARGVGQILGVTPQTTIDEAKQLDAPLMNTGGGMVGNIGANIAMTAAPGGIATTVPRAAGLGAALGGIQPVASDESRLTNIGVGAAGGALGQTLANTVGRFVKPVQSKLDPLTASFAQKAAAEGIELRPAQITGSKPLKIIDSVLENLPFTSDAQIAAKEAQQRAYTAAVLKRAGLNTDTATADVMLTQKKALGKALGDIAERNSLDFSSGLKTKLDDILKDAADHLPPEEVAKLAGTIQQIGKGYSPGQAAQTVPSAILNQSGQPFAATVAAVPPKPMLGTVYQGWREPLRDMADNTATGRYFGKIRSALDSEFSSQLAGADARAFKDTSRKYANIKTIIDAMGGAGNLPAKGQVSPAQLSAALARAVGKENKTLGVGDLNDLSRIGQLFIKESIPDSGTAQRALYQKILTSPLEAIGAAVGGLSVPLQKFMNTQAGKNYLVNGALQLTAQKKMLAEALRRGAVGAGATLPAYVQQ